ncbi:MAG: ABC transporter ATP-binding protein [Acidimicrobiia bacterium]|nr:ABC transporter ATP-binding protein [Acidimicrobiia bacterium]
MTTERLIVVTGLRAGYTKEVEILRGIDIELDDHEVVTIIGPNGAGKSTLIKAIFGLLTPTAGSVLLRGEQVTGKKAHVMVGKGVGYVPQVKNVFETLTVEENLTMGAYLNRANTASQRDRLFEWFPMLAERRTTRAGKLSGGQRQLVAMARALMANPSILLLDEPSAGLSPSNVDEIFNRIREIKDRGVSILMVEQNARRALALSDRGYVLDQGTNAYTGTGRDLLHDPKIGDLYLGGR